MLTDRVEALDKTRLMSPGGYLDDVLAAFTRIESEDSSLSLVSKCEGSSGSVISAGSESS